MANRSKAEKLIIEFLNDLDPSGYSTSKYKIVFAEMSDKDFDTYMIGLRDGTKTIVAFQPPFSKNSINTENNLKIASKYGVEFFERLLISGKPGLPDYLTPIKYLVLILPLKRQSQNLFKKISIPENNKTVDEMTGQPTGASKGAKLSYSELQILSGMGLEHSIIELFKYRGGDNGGFNAYNTMLLRYGKANLGALDPYATGAESTKTLHTILTAMHIRNTL